LTRPRLTVAARVLVTLCAIAALSTGLALHLQHRSLSADLKRAARDRLERAASAADRLVTSRLQTMTERYQAISRTPEFRANLEVRHQPTLAYFAELLAAEQDASLILFLDRAVGPLVFAGAQGLIAPSIDHICESRSGGCGWSCSNGPMQSIAMLAALGMPSDRDCMDAGSSEQEATLIAHRGAPFAIVAMPLQHGRQRVGFLVAVEAIADETLAGWSELCGAAVSIEAPRQSDPARLELAVRSVAPLELRVAASLEAEREALARSRNQVLTAGAIALALAFGASALLAGGLVRPLGAIQRATERIGRGDLTTPLDLDREDEFGDVARAFNVMIQRLYRTQERLQSAQRLARLGNWVLDAHKGALQHFGEFARIYDIPASEEPLTLDALCRRLHPDDRDRFSSVIEDCLQNGTPFRLDHRVITRDGEERTLHSQGERIAREGRPARLEGTVQDITDRKVVEEQIRYLAYHDSLTGLGNRRLFKERLELALREAGNEGRMVAVMFLDIDDFKIINDTLGHSVGDELLKQVARRLVSCLRSTDFVAHASCTVSRLGGDEFTVLISDLEDARQIASVAERILESLSISFDVKDEEIVIGGSIGITVSPADGIDVETLLGNSDTAMYHAKRHGRNTFQFYTESMKAAAFKRLTLENNLRRAIDRGEFRLYYQPKVELSTGQVTGVEALLRWRDPAAGIVLPSEFIPLAEEMGSIVLIGSWVLRAAAQQAVAWQKANGTPLRVSVNLSPLQIEDPGFAKTVASVLEETGLDPQYLEFEITESTLMQDEESNIALLQRLKGMGIRLSLDDFGTGYSSLSYLRRLPIDTLKIDRSFVQRIASDPEDAAFAGAIIGMAKVLRLRVVVEGVETEEQRDLLEELGCDEIQGFLFSTPVPADEVTAVLAEIHGAARPKPKRRVRRRA